MSKPNDSYKPVDNPYIKFKKTYREIDLNSVSGENVKEEDFIIGKRSGQPIKKVVLKGKQEVFETNEFLDFINNNKTQKKYSTSSDDDKKKSVSSSNSYVSISSDEDEDEEDKVNSKNNNFNTNVIPISLKSELKDISNDTKQITKAKTNESKSNLTNINVNNKENIPKDFDKVFNSIMVETTELNLNRNSLKRFSSDKELSFNDIKIRSKEKIKNHEVKENLAAKTNDKGTNKNTHHKT